jgi:amino acid adenylation domain-containing protein
VSVDPLALPIHRQFEQQARRTPEATALSFADERMSYRELDDRSNQLARHLVEQAVGPETLVGICVERSLEMVVGLLGILKAGGAYVPLDPGYPADRLEYMLADSALRVVLTQARLLGSLPAGVSRVSLDGDWPRIAARTPEPTRTPVWPESAAYMIYTSGSTGRPKGAINRHVAIANRLRWMQDEYGLTPEDAVVQKTPFSFDVSVWELFWPLLNGARLVMARPGGHREPDYLADLIARERVTTVHFVPSMLAVFLADAALGERCRSLRQVMCSGEALPFELQERFFDRLGHAELHNLYGPTEAAVDVTYWRCERGDPRKVVPIGRAVANTRMAVLDDALGAVAIGEGAELYIAGVQLGRGYHRRPDLTAERFIPDPLSTEPGARMYRTGDLARWRSDGALEYLGRVDHQVKIHGFRIELGEIEAALRERADVREAVVLAREDTPGQKRLVAYVTGDGEVDVASLEQALAARLPEYMVPAAFVVLETMPTTPNGKLDRKALPAPGRRRGEHVAPRTATEKQLAALWQDVLGEQRVGLHDHFFRLGGDSIAGIQLVARAKAAGLAISFKHLSERPTLGALASVAGAEATPPPAPVDRDRPLPLSLGQVSFWRPQRPSRYVVPIGKVYFAYRFEGPFQLDVLERALSEIARRHEALRTVFAVVEGSPVQRVEPARPLRIAMEDLGALSGDAQATAFNQRVTREIEPTFDREHGARFRALVLRRSAHDHVFFFIVDHIVFDGWSKDIFVRELRALYRAFADGRPSPLTEPPIQLADFATWQRRRYAADALERERAYWREQLKDAPREIALPFDRARAGNKAIAYVDVVLDARRTAAIREAVAPHGGLYVTLWTALSATLFTRTGQTDLVIGTFHANRGQAGALELIGSFANFLAVRTRVDPTDTLGAFRERVRATLVDVFEHADLPHTWVIDALQPPPAPERSPLFNVALLLLTPPPSVEDGGVPRMSAAALDIDHGGNRVDLTLKVIAGEQTSLSFEYNPELFDRATIEALMRLFRQTLDRLIDDPSHPIDAPVRRAQ